MEENTNNRPPSVNEKVADALGMDLNFNEDDILSKMNKIEETITPEPVAEEVNDEDFLVDDEENSPETLHVEIQVRDEETPTDILSISEEDPLEDRILDHDFNKARNRLSRLIERGEEMFEDAYGTAQDLQVPQGYSVAGELFKNVVAANDKLIKLHQDRLNTKKTKKENSKESEGDDSSGTTHNNLIMTTDGLMRFLKEADLKKTENRDVIDEESDAES